MPITQKNSLFIVLSFLVISCTPQKKEPQVVQLIADPNLESNNLNPTDSLDLSDSLNYYVRWKRVDDSTIVAFPLNSQKLLHVYAYPTFRSLGTYLQKGRGPGEFISRNWGNTINPNEFFLYDIGRKKIFNYTLNDQKEIIEKESFDIYLDTAQGSRAITKPFPFIQRIDEKHFLMKVMLRNNAYLETADLTTGKVIQRYLMVPEEEQTDEMFSYDKYDSRTVANQKQLVMFYSDMDRLEFFDINADRSITLKASYGKKEPHVEEGDIDFMYYLDVQIVEDNA